MGVRPKTGGSSVVGVASGESVKEGEMVDIGRV